MKVFNVAPLPGSGAWMEVYLRDKEYEFAKHERRPCALIFPGGGYGMVAPREGEPVALEFARAGYQACVLHYTVRDCDDTPYLGALPLREAAAALRTLRMNADEWGIDPERITVIGSSAGGHLAASLSVFGADESRLPGSGDGLSKPNAMVLCYPVIYYDEAHHSASVFNLTGKHGQCPENDSWCLDRYVTPDTCPGFLWQTVFDDCVPMEHSLTMAAALRKAGVRFDLHLFSQGWHGIGLANAEVGSSLPTVALWLPMALQWLNGIGVGPGY